VKSADEMTPRERNQFMIARIRSADAPDPYREAGYALRVLTAAGRETGQPRSWPIAVVQLLGQHYLCAPNRRRDWVRNLLAAGWCTLEGDDPATQTATLTEDDAAAQAVAAYLGALGRASSEWPFPGDAPAITIRRHLNEIAVFRLTPQERVAGERVELRQVPAGLARVLADPEADAPDSQSWAHGYPLPGTRMAARNLVRQAEAGGDGNSQWGMFHIVLRETGEVIGDIGFHGPPDEAGTVEIGYSIVEQYRGRGLAGESAVAICGLAWSRPEVARIIAQTDKDNAASAGVLRHAGFREDGAADARRNFSLDRP
jgi:RimJ/RimL family protein N-acetyltransferase